MARSAVPITSNSTVATMKLSSEFAGLLAFTEWREPADDGLLLHAASKPRAAMMTAPVRAADGCARRARHGTLWFIVPSSGRAIVLTMEASDGPEGLGR